MLFYFVVTGESKIHKIVCDSLCCSFDGGPCISMKMEPGTAKFRLKKQITFSQAFDKPPTVAASATKATNLWRKKIRTFKWTLFSRASSSDAHAPRDHFFLSLDFHELWRIVMSVCLFAEIKWQWTTLVLGSVTTSVHYSCL